MEITGDPNRPYVTYVLATWACAGYQQRNKKATNHRLRLLHVYAFLRHYAGSSSYIPPERASPSAMAVACGVSLNTFKTWVRKLHYEGWLFWRDGALQLNSEEAIYSLLGLLYGKKVDQKFYFNGDIATLKQPYYWIYLANIEDNRRRQAYRFLEKVKADNEAMTWLLQYLEAKGHHLDIITDNPQFIVSIFKNIYLVQFSDGKSAILDFLRTSRPDTNRSTRGMAKVWKTGATTVSRIKKKLVEQRLAHIQKPGTVSSIARNHNKHCHVRYNNAQKVTFQALCDDIVPIKYPCAVIEQDVFEPP